MTQEQSDIMCLEICKVIAKQSKAVRAKVGALIVKDNNILSMGFNGTPAGMDNCCEQYVPDKPMCRFCIHLHTDACDTCESASMVTKPEVLHAESNAFMKLVRRGGVSSTGATMYITDSPCIDCAKMILQAGIVRVVYLRTYRDTRGIDLLKHNGIVIDKYDEAEL